MIVGLMSIIVQSPLRHGQWKNQLRTLVTRLLVAARPPAQENLDFLPQLPDLERLLPQAIDLQFLILQVNLLALTDEFGQRLLQTRGVGVEN